MGPVKLVHLLVLIVWLVVTPEVYSASASYSFTSFDVPDSSFTRVSAINNRGAIVGDYQDNQQKVHGFIYDRREVTTIDVPEAVSTSASGINDKGAIVGVFFDEDSRAHGFLFRKNRFITIDAPFPDAGDTFLNGINNRGQIVGESLFLNPPEGEPPNEQGFLSQRGEFEAIEITRPASIDNRGQIVGERKILIKGAVTTLDYPGADAVVLLGINDKGHIVGYYSLLEESSFHGFLYADGEFTPIDVPFENATDTFPTSINSHGQIVGIYFTEENTIHSFIAMPQKAKKKRN